MAPSGGYTYRKLFLDCLGHPADFGIKGGNVNDTARRRVRNGMGATTELFALLKSLLGLKYKSD
jgi:hypothetical protein